MKYALGAVQMKEIDRYTMDEIGIPSCVLMEKAALAVSCHVKELCAKEDRILAVCGYGNNGGDGIAAARILHMQGYSVEVFMAGDRKQATKETKQQMKIARKTGVRFVRKLSTDTADVIVDALFGIGLSRPVADEFYGIVDKINASGKTVVSVDIPSGVSAENGNVLGIAVKADVTVTFGYQKIGCLLYPGVEYCGKVYVEDIGFATGALLSEVTRFFVEEPSKVVLPVRHPDANKGTYGKVLVIAGSKNMSGAAYFAATAAYRMGAGLVRILTAKENREILQRQIPEAILTTYDSLENGISEEDISSMKEAVSWADVVLIGPGLSQSLCGALLVNYVIAECKVPLVMDADALNVLAKLITDKVSESEGTAGRIAYLAKLLPAKTILTPHKMELSRLTGIPMAELVTSLIDSSATCTYNNEIIFVKKDVRTIVSFGKTDYINVTGNDGMATAGSGDVLAGMIAGYLAQEKDPVTAAVMATYLHGMAGDIAAGRKGVRGMIAGDILEAIPEALTACCK